MVENRKALTAEQLEYFDTLSSAACDWVTQKVYEQFAQKLAVFGQSGKERCREDIAFHLKYLRPTLETGDAAPFIEYLNWSHEVLTSRMGKAYGLDYALACVGQYFAKEMPDGGNLIKHTLEESAGAISSKHFEIPCQPGWSEAFSFEAAILAGDRVLATSILEDLHTLGHSMLEIDAFVIEPAMNSIGQKWQENEVSIAQEHLATATASTAMAICFSHYFPMESNGKRVLLACIENNQHMLGLRMVSDALEIDGWEVRYLGADTPSTALMEDIVDFEPDVVGLSIAFVHQLNPVRSLINQIRAASHIKSPYIILGGVAVKKYPNLFTGIGADACASDVLAIKDLFA